MQCPGFPCLLRDWSGTASRRTASRAKCSLTIRMELVSVVQQGLPVVQLVHAVEVFCRWHTSAFNQSGWRVFFVALQVAKNDRGQLLRAGPYKASEGLSS